MKLPAASDLSAGMARRGVLRLAGLIALGGCASLAKRSDFYGTVLGGLGKSPDGAPTRDYADKLPYASLRAWFNGRQRSLLVLGEEDRDGNFGWFGREKSAITTFGPYVTRVMGIDDELRGTLLSGAWSRDLRRMNGVTASRTLYLASENRTANVELRSRFHVGGTDRVDVFGVKKQLSRLDERISSGGIERYRNSYWFDPADGLCWKSRQLPVPTMPPLNIEIVKFPRSFAS